jgi:hypothetical protein
MELLNGLIHIGKQFGGGRAGEVLLTELPKI